MGNTLSVAHAVSEETEHLARDSSVTLDAVRTPTDHDATPTCYLTDIVNELDCRTADHSEWLASFQSSLDDKSEEARIHRQQLSSLVAEVLDQAQTLRAQIQEMSNLRTRAEETNAMLQGVYGRLTKAEEETALLKKDLNQQKMNTAILKRKYNEEALNLLDEKPSLWPIGGNIRSSTSIATTNDTKANASLDHIPVYRQGCDARTANKQQASPVAKKARKLPMHFTIIDSSDAEEIQIVKVRETATKIQPKTSTRLSRKISVINGTAPSPM